MSSSIEDGKALFDALINVIHQNRLLIEELAGKIERLEHIGGGGKGNGLEVYTAGETYKRYQMLVDPNTDIVYITVPHDGDEYVAISVETDCEDGNLRLLGYDGQIVPFNHRPSPQEIDALLENVTVVEYNPSDTPYTGILTNDNNNG
jgi:hypothetical protein